ncbi:hypothetical protein B0A52_01649 [Exophiala mesophila]|uniref:Transcription factor domain-containing protein n=1 Tax=Exophiala mesophila TaxID=212818 RepID=A0A438NFL9_EXOME|nr:hypothetical protein B0A52_01649 [Exophiala mesophila]
MQHFLPDSKATTSFDNRTSRGGRSQRVPIFNDEFGHADLVIRGRPPNVQVDASSASLGSSSFHHGFSVDRVSPQWTRSTWSSAGQQHGRIQEINDNDEEGEDEVESQVQEVTPLVYLDEWQSDPFSALPSDLPKHVLAEQMHQSKTCLLEMVTNRSSDSYGPHFAGNILNLAVNNTTLLYAMMFAGMMFARTANNQTTPSVLELQFGARAIHMLSQQLRSPATAATEANIWAVVALGYCDNFISLRPGKHPRQSFLKELQSLHIYGRMTVNLAHIQGLKQLIQLLGGLDKIRTPGIAQVISFADLFESTRYLLRPGLPCVFHTRTFMVNGRLSVSLQERRWAENALGPLGSSFREIWGTYSPLPVQKLCEVIRDACDFTIVVENYAEGRWVPRLPAELTDQRNYVHHKLMSLDSDAEIAERGEWLHDQHYEPCRLACLAYSFLVIFPFPPILGVFERLGSRLQKSIMRSSLRLEELGRARQELHLWIVVMGAIICTGLPERAFYIRELSQTLKLLKVSSFDSLVRILQTFLWHPKTSNYDAMDLWRALKLDV